MTVDETDEKFENVVFLAVVTFEKTTFSVFDGIIAYPHSSV